MIESRNDLKKYAYSLCRTMLERTASRHKKGIVPTVIDSMGYVPTFLEEFCRPFWGFAPVIMEEEEEVTLDVCGKDIPLTEWLSDILYEGLAEGSGKSWEKYRFCGAGWGLDFQNVTELAGLLTGLYFCREKTWDRFTPERQKLFAERIFSFCKGECEHPAGNNHIWFPLLCILVLKKFGFSSPETDGYIRTGLEKLETMYLSEGWYSDGAFGRFDYYEVWSMHTYPLLWCIIEDESFPGYNEYRSKYISRTEQFISRYTHCFDSDGAFPAFGRSLDYKFAAVCIFPLAALAGCNMDYGLARNITLKNINYFAENMHLTDDGILPTGFLYESPALVENYTSDGGAYWCTKAFLCLLMKEEHPFWSSEEMPLPIEKREFLVSPGNGRINLMLSGTKSCGVTLYNNVSQYYQNGRYHNNFNDMASYYCKFAYNSKSGFAISTHDKISCDNMISLLTPDWSMASHRWGFTDSGRSGSIMLSSHIPFSNDSGTHIETAILPFDDGCHVRLHRVTLSQSYIVREGGFSIGLWDEYHTSSADGNTITVENGRLWSRLSAVATVPFELSEKKPQPGLHILAPQACYPCLKTEALPAGTYYFAGAYRISEEKEAGMPRLELTDDRLIILHNGTKTEIPFSLL